MDVSTLFGLFVGLAAVLGSFLMEGGHISALLQIPAMVLVIFGTLGASIATTSMSQLTKIPKVLMIAFFEKKVNLGELIELITELATKARKNGLLSLEKELPNIKDRFLRKALQLAIDGFEADKIREILETEMAYMEERHKAGALFFQKMGGFAPTMGIIGTVLGLIHALGSLESSKNIASAIASAFIATLWGISTANLMYLPISDKLRAKHQEESLHYQMITEGVISMALGENPRIIKMKLYSFLLPEKRKEE